MEEDEDEPVDLDFGPSSSTRGSRKQGGWKGMLRKIFCTQQSNERRIYKIDKDNHRILRCQECLFQSMNLPSSPVSDVENFESWRSTHGDWNRNDGHLPSPVRGDEEDEDDDDEVPVAEGSEEEAEEVTDDDFSE